MHVLFVTNRNVDPVVGGIERVTYVLADALTRCYGYKCYSAYVSRFSDTESLFDDEMQIPLKEEARPFSTQSEKTANLVARALSDFIGRNKIDIVVVQGMSTVMGGIVWNIRKAVDENPGCKMVVVYHNKPGCEYTCMSFDVLMHRLFSGHEFVYYFKQLILWCFRLPLQPCLWLKYRDKYRSAWLAADKLVVLSDAYIKRYTRCAGVPVTDKFVAIGNVRSFEGKFDMAGYDRVKLQEVLIVSRFDDKHKRLGEAFRIWSIVERDGRFADWKLNVVGYGHERDYYETLVRRLGLKNVVFHGMTESRPFFNTASVFMLTSAFEGFPMVLTEAQMSAAVPMAYDTFAAVHDMIVDGVNGCIIRKRASKTYARRLMELMAAGELRRKMAEEGLRTIDEFSIDNIAPQWRELFEGQKGGAKEC